MKPLKLIIIFISTFLSINLFAGTNPLISPKNGNTIIDVGILHPQSNYQVNIPKEWVDTDTDVTNIEQLILSSPRILSEKWDCEKDFLGRENCTQDAVTCDTNIQRTSGSSKKTTKTITEEYNIDPKLKAEMEAEKKDPDTNIYYAYFSEDNPSLFGVTNMFYFDKKSCGTGNVSNGDFKDCVRAQGFNYTYCGYPITPPGIIKNDKGQYCVRQKYENYLEWCRGDGNDGSWAIYKCSYRFNKDGSEKPLCNKGFIEKDGHCVKEYTYYTYSCPDDDKNEYDKVWKGPVVDSGGDCLGQCGSNGCSCNSENPPSGNCVRESYT